MRELRTERLVLRPLPLERARLLDSGGRAPDWAPDYPTEGDLVVAGLVARSGAEPGPWGPWELRVVPEGVVVGGAGFHGPPSEGTVEVGYGLAPSWRGRGLAREAVAALVGLARDHGVDRVVAHVDPQNAASVRLLVALGFGVRSGNGVDSPGPPEHLLLVRELS